MNMGIEVFLFKLGLGFQRRRPKKLIFLKLFYDFIFLFTVVHSSERIDNSKFSLLHLPTFN